MDRALCLEDNRTYATAAFAALPAEQLGRFRLRLQCPECLAVAFFRRASVDGKSACFGAVHSDSCGLAREGGGSDRSFVAYRDSVRKSASELLAKAADQTIRLDIGPGPLPEGSLGISLRRALEFVVHAPDFATSKAPLAAGNMTNWTPAKLFCDLKDATDESIGQLRAWRGLVGSTGSGGEHDLLWLNTGIGDRAVRDLSVLITGRARINGVLEQAGAKTPEELIGRHFMVLGRLERSANTAKQFIRLSHSRQVAFV